VRVRCQANSGARLPLAYLDPSGGYRSTTAFPLQIEKEYVVYAITLKSGGVWYYLLDENRVGYPVWYPAPLFSITDHRLSRFWVFGGIDSEIRNGNAILAPVEWARDPAGYYDRLSDRRPDAVESFARYRDLLDSEYRDESVNSKAEDLGDGWLMCPKCSNAWSAPIRGEMVRCPQCGERLVSPAPSGLN